MCRQTLAKKIDDRFQTSKQALIDILKKTSAVCTTADVWKSRGRSYMGVTCHWLESESLLRKSACLTVRRIFGSHTYDVLAKTLSAVHKEFQISRKVVVTITDSGSNFLKAFRVFSREPEMQCEDEFDEDFEDDEIVILIFILNLTAYNSLVTAYCHLLNLIASVDCETALKRDAYSSLNRSTFAKLQTLFNKQSRSTLASEKTK